MDFTKQYQNSEYAKGKVSNVLACLFMQAFGVGAFEEDDDDIYAVDHMSNYDAELTADRSSGLHGWTGPPKESARG